MGERSGAEVSCSGRGTGQDSQGKLDRNCGEEWKPTSDLRGENLLAVAPPPLIGAPVCQNTGTLLANSFTSFHKKQFSFVIPLFSPRILAHAYDYCLRIPRIAYAHSYSRACIPSVIDIRSHSLLRFSSFSRLIIVTHRCYLSRTIPRSRVILHRHVHAFARFYVRASS